MRTVLTPDTCYADLPDGGAALVNPDGNVLHLNAVAAVFLSTTIEHDRETAVTVLAERFDTSTINITRDLGELNCELARHNVIREVAS